MITITVNASVKYDVIIGSGLLENCGKYVSSVTIMLTEYIREQLKSHLKKADLM